jgi:hypothetical protein
MFVYNPDGFEPRDHVPPHLHAYADCARVLVHLVECGRAQIKAQFRRLARVHHPDCGGDAENFRRIMAAYEQAIIDVKA